MWAPSSAGDLLPPDAAYPKHPGPPKHLDRGMLRRLRQASGSAELMRLFAQADPQLVQYFRDGGTVGSDSDPESPGRADPSMLDAQVGSGMDTKLWTGSRLVGALAPALPPPAHYTAPLGPDFCTRLSVRSVLSVAL